MTKSEQGQCSIFRHALSTILIKQWLHENKRTELSINEKVELLKNSDGKSSRQLAEKYGVGRTRVQNLMERKREILDSYEDDANFSYSSIAATQHSLLTP